MAALIASRVVQGAGAGLVSPAALAGAVSGFPPSVAGPALGIWGASAGVANLVGPLLGGLRRLRSAGARTGGCWSRSRCCVRWGSCATCPEIGHPEAVGPKPACSTRWSSRPLIAGLTFAVMIGTFYLAEQYLQRVAGYSAIGASAVLVVVAVVVGVAAPIAGRLVDARGERLPALLGFLTAGIGLAVLGIPGVSLQSPATMLPLIPVGFGLGMLFVPTSRAALNSNPASAHGRTSAALSVGRLLGAAIGAGLAGAALAGGPSASTVHTALLFACGLCLLVGMPASMLLVPPLPAASNATPS